MKFLACLIAIVSAFLFGWCTPLLAGSIVDRIAVLEISEDARPDKTTASGFILSLRVFGKLLPAKGLGASQSLQAFSVLI